LKIHQFAARALGLWLAIQSMSTSYLIAHKWPLLVTGGAAALVVNFYFLTMWTAVPLLITVISLGAASYWPQNCATWFGWIGMLFRLIAALAISNLAWAVSAAFQ
jgi:hypothetical protein